MGDKRESLARTGRHDASPVVVVGSACSRDLMSRTFLCLSTLYEPSIASGFMNMYMCVQYVHVHVHVDVRVRLCICIIRVYMQCIHVLANSVG